MAEKYAKYAQANATGGVAGFRNNAWITLKEWIETEVVPATNVNMGDRFKIATAHTWVEDMGAIPVYLFPKTAEMQGELAGDQGAKIAVYKPKIKILGDNPAVTELLNNLLNKEVIIFLEKMDGTVVQFGNGEFPAMVDSGQPSVSAMGTGGAGTEIVFEAFYKAFYVPGAAGITEYGD
jgi:hypothetical protein